MVSGRIRYFPVQVLSDSILGFEKHRQIRPANSLDVLPENHPAFLSMVRIPQARNRFQIAAHEIGPPFVTEQNVGLSVLNSCQEIAN